MKIDGIKITNYFNKDDNDYFQIGNTMVDIEDSYEDSYDDGDFEEYMENHYNFPYSYQEKIIDFDEFDNIKEYTKKEYKELQRKNKIRYIFEDKIDSLISELYQHIPINKRAFEEYDDKNYEYLDKKDFFILDKEINNLIKDINKAGFMNERSHLNGFKEDLQMLKRMLGSAAEFSCKNNEGMYSEDFCKALIKHLRVSGNLVIGSKL